MDIAQVYLTNRLVGEEQSNLHGTLSLDNQNTSEYEYYREPSGSLVEIVISDPYFIKTYLDVDGDYIHNQWASSSKYFLENSISSISDQNIDAFYKLQNTVNISVHHPIALQLHDPWYLENPDAEPAEWVQPDAYFYPDISHEVFQDQNPNFIPNIPTYRLRATEIVENGAFTYEFTNWSGDAEFNGHEADLETDVVFTEPYGTITANYEAVEEAISVILRDANGNALSGLIQVEIAELPLNTEPESLTYDNSMNPLELAMVLDSDSRTIWGQIVHTTPIVRLVDEFYPLQWHLNNTGQSGGISGYDINTELAWDITTGSEEIIVAVIDDGVEEHEDFEDWIKLILWERERLFK